MRDFFPLGLPIWTDIEKAKGVYQQKDAGAYGGSMSLYLWWFEMQLYLK